MFKQSLMATLLMAAAWPVFAGTPVLDAREANQRARIAEGVASGELTRPETRRLVRGERRLHRHEAIAKRTGGTVTAAERVRLQREADRMSARIHRQKHDRQVRP